MESTKFITFNVPVMLLIIQSLTPTRAYSTGAPTIACDQMEPGHGFDAQSGEPTARLILEKTTVAPGQPVQIRIEAKEGEDFKGFIVQARDDTGPDIQIGSFGGSESVKYVNCGSGISNSVTHTSNEPKKSVELSWIPPPDFEGAVVMKYSIVKEFTTYWVRMEAGRIRVTKARKVEEESGAPEVEAEAEAEGYAEADAEVEPETEPEL